ncbi:MAG: endonuclease/exonuclease/phosphatase family protein [Chloroflexota bacterium]
MVNKVDMKILSCNIRFYGADDGENSWAHRKGICAQIIEARQPDIVCFQEMWHPQFIDLQESLPGFASYGLMQDPAGHNPLNAIFYRQDAFKLITAGGYWLSKTPHIAGSKSWDSKGIRYANWVRLQDNETETEFRVINTHFDHMGWTARDEQAKLIVAESQAYPSDYRQILVGDLNCDQTSTPIDLLKRGGWQDTFETIHGSDDPGCTYHGFIGPKFEADFGKIDWIFGRGALHVVDAKIIDDAIDARYPSDHYFVSATLIFDDIGLLAQLPPDIAFLAEPAMRYQLWFPNDVEDFTLRWLTNEDRGKLEILAHRLRQLPYQDLLDDFFDRFLPDKYPMKDHPELMYLQTLIFCMGEMQLLALS